MVSNVLTSQCRLCRVLSHFGRTDLCGTPCAKLVCQLQCVQYLALKRNRADFVHTLHQRLLVMPQLLQQR